MEFLSGFWSGTESDFILYHPSWTDCNLNVYNTKRLIQLRVIFSILHIRTIDSQAI